GKQFDSNTRNDGLNTGYAGNGTGGGQLVNIAGAQEVVIDTSGGLGEAQSAGVTLNVIPRDGSNTFTGEFIGSGSSGSLQGSNYTQSLQDQGLKTPSQLIGVHDINPMGGGRIVRDRVWFYFTYRDWGRRNSV